MSTKFDAVKVAKVALGIICIAIPLGYALSTAYVAMDRAHLSAGEDAYTPGGPGVVESTGPRGVRVRLSSGRTEVYNPKEVEERDPETVKRPAGKESFP